MAVAPDRAFPFAPGHHIPLKVEPALLAAGIHAGKMPGDIAFRVAALARLAVARVVSPFVLHDDKLKLVNAGKGFVPVVRLAKEGPRFGHRAPSSQRREFTGTKHELPVVCGSIWQSSTTSISAVKREEADVVSVTMELSRDD
jgi:hypothetical protein